MTFLELVQELHRESGAAGRAPTTVASVTGEAARLVGWIKKANLAVQDLWENWKFLRCEYSQALTSGTNTLSAPTTPNAIGSGMWDLDTFKIQRVSDTFASPLVAVEYDEIKDEILDTTSSTPWRVTVMPDNSLRFEGTPNAADTVTADFYREPIRTEFDNTALNADDQESSIPAKFQQVIIGKALMYYGNYEGAVEAKTQGKELYDDYLARLENSELPNGGKSRYRVGKGKHIEVIAQ